MNAITPSKAIGLLALRVSVGAAFLWAGLGKLFGPEPFSAAGFLQFGTAGTSGWPFSAGAEGAIVNPTAGFWAGLATNEFAMAVVNILVPYGQLAIGAALIVGFATRFAGTMGFLQMALIAVAGWDFAHGVFNQPVILGIAALATGLLAAGEVYGVDAYVDETPTVKRTPVLRYLLA